MVQSVNSSMMKQWNKASILLEVRKKGLVSRTDLMNKTSLRSGTISKLVAELMEENILEEVGKGDSSGGRKPRLLQLHSQGITVIGLEMNASRVTAVLMDALGNILSSSTSEVRPPYHFDTILEVLLEHVDALQKRAAREGRTVRGIGLACPGPVNPHLGEVIRFTNLPGWEKTPILRLLEEHFDLPVVIEKDAKAAVLGEYWFGKGQGISDMVFLLADMGIGSGAIVSGNLHQGHQQIAGEVGHISIDVDGPLCNCGNYGCLEAVASGIALEKKAVEYLKRGGQSALTSLLHANEDLDITMEDLIWAESIGDSFCSSLFDECGRYIGLGLATCVNMYNPKLIIIGGTIPLRVHSVFKQASKLTLERSLDVLSEQLEIIPATFGEQACAVGAGAIMVDQILTFGLSTYETSSVMSE